MVWAIDIDGVITSNPDFFKWWTYQLTKKGNSNVVYIVSSRNPSRISETFNELYKWGITFDKYFYMGESGKKLKRDWKTQAKWKIDIIRTLRPHVWIDNDFKMYERVFKMNLDELVPGVERIQI